VNKVRALIVAAVLAAVLAVTQLDAIPAAVDRFTIIAVPDIHYYDVDGNVSPAAALWDNYAKPWIINSYSDPTWNTRGVIGLGDMVCDPAKCAPPIWQHIAADFAGFYRAGMITVASAGNHDTSSGIEANWDNYFATMISSSLNLFYVNSAHFRDPATGGPLTTYAPRAVNQYARLDVPTSIGTVKLGLAVNQVFGTSADLAELTTVMNGDADRQQIFGTHMFLAELPGFDGSHPCIYDEPNCEVSSHAPYGFTDGATMWGFLQRVPNLLAIFNGHSHNDAQAGIPSKLLTGNAGNAVQALSGRSVGPQYGSVIAAKFDVSARTVTFYAVHTATNTIENAWSGAPVVRPWTPLISGSAAPPIRVGGAVTAAAFGGSPSIAPGTWIEIYGTGLATQTREWAGSDFNGLTAPTALNGTGVTIGGLRAFISYISPGQVNVQVPFNVVAGIQNLVVTTPNGDTAAFPIAVMPAQPGLLAPQQYRIGGRQYVAAMHSDGTWVLPPGSIPGLTTRQAQPGETILLYGIGFGPVTASIPAGQIVTTANQLAQPLQIAFGGAPAPLSYAGLAPNYVGLYQFNVVVPNVSDDDALPLTFALGGVSGTQVLYTAVKQ
jgi:uncharacterized protein (TIGR03437 family)